MTLFPLPRSATLRRVGARRFGVLARIVRPPAESGVTYLNPTVLRDAPMSHQEAAALAEGDVSELARRIRLYRQGPPPVRRREQRGSGVLRASCSRCRRSRRRSRRSFWPNSTRFITLAVSWPPPLLSDAFEHVEKIADDVALMYLRRAWLERALEETVPAAVS